MTKAAAALYDFFNSFGIPAYDEYSVPDTAVLPYITYQQQFPNWREVTSISARVWYAANTYEDLFAKVDEISDKIGEGHLITFDGGSLYLFKDSIFSLVAPTDDDNVKSVYLNIGLHALCK